MVNFTTVRILLQPFGIVNSRFRQVADQVHACRVDAGGPEQCWSQCTSGKLTQLFKLVPIHKNVISQGALFGVSGRFPSIYAGSVMMGQAFGGLAPSAIAVGMLSLNVEPKVLGPAAFGSVLGLLIVALATERWLSKNRFFLYFTEGKDNPITGDTSDHDAEVDQLSYKDILKRSWIYLLSGFLIYSTTLSIFPALTSLGKSAYLH